MGVPMIILSTLMRPTAVPQKPINASSTAICIKTFVNLCESAKMPHMRTSTPNNAGMSAKMLIRPVVKYPTSPRTIKSELYVKV